MALIIDPIDVYVFRSGRFARNGDSVVCVGPRHAIEALLGQEAVGRLFFGYALYRDEGGADLIGGCSGSKARHCWSTLPHHWHACILGGRQASDKLPQSS